MAIDVVYTSVGLLVGLLVGLTGIGGGALMTPLLVLVFGVNPAVAVGTDLIYATATKGLGVCVYARRQLVAWHVVWAMIAGSAPGSLFAIWLLNHLERESVETLIRGLLGVALIFTSVTLAFKERIQQSRHAHLFGRFGRVAHRNRFILTALMGFLIGVLVTFTSVGSGALGTAMLVMLFPGLSMTTVVGTDLAHAVMLTAIAGAGHLRFGTVDTGLLVSLLAGSLPGVYLGSRFGMGLSERPVRLVLAGMLMLVGLRLAL